MQNYTRDRYGTWTYSYPNGSVTMSVTSGYRRLSCSPVYRGDFVRPNPHSYSIIDNNYAKGYVQSYSNGVLDSTTSGSFQNEATAFVNTTTLVSIARNEALAKLAEKARGNLDLATSIAEGGQTLKMLNLSQRLTSNLSRMQAAWDRKIYTRLRTIRSRKALQRYLKRWERGAVLNLPLARTYYRKARIDSGFVQRVTGLGANGWLEFTYGWSPLMGDIRGIATNIVGRVHGSSKRFSAVGKVVISERRDQPASASYHRVTETATGYVKVRVSATMNGSFDPGMAAWTSMNPISVGYELLPYSFVVDWAFNIGDYLRSLESSMLFRNDYQYGFISTLTVVNYESMESGRALGGSNTYSVYNRLAKKKVVNFERNLSVSYPIPEAPKLNLNLGSSRLLSMASLLRQLLR